MSAKPGIILSPSLASLTSIAQMEFNRSANDFVNNCGMCCTIKIPGAFGGICNNTSLSASVPPVDAPIATILCVLLINAWLVCGCLDSGFLKYSLFLTLTLAD